MDKKMGIMLMTQTTWSWKNEQLLMNGNKHEGGQERHPHRVHLSHSDEHQPFYKDFISTNSTKEPVISLLPQSCVCSTVDQYNRCHCPNISFPISSFISTPDTPRHHHHHVPHWQVWAVMICHHTWSPLVSDEVCVCVSMMPISQAIYLSLCLLFMLHQSLLVVTKFSS